MRKFAPLLVLLSLVAVPSLAYAAADDGDAIAALVRQIARGILDGHYLAASAVALSLLTTLARLSWQLGGLGGAALLGAQAFAGSVSAALVAGAPLSWDVVGAAVRLGVAAAGGYSLLQPLARWLRPRIERSIPQPLRGLLLAVLRLVDASPPPAASTRAPTAPLAAALLIGLLAAGCATARQAGTAGAAVGLDCAAPAIQSAARESGVLARAFVLSAISGSGEVDSAALRAAARELKSEALRCSFLAALAAVSSALESASAPPSVAAAPLIGQLPAGSVLRALALDLPSSEWGISDGVIVEGL